MPKIVCDFKENSNLLKLDRYYLEDPSNITVLQHVEKTETLVGEDQYWTCTWITITKVELICTYHIDGVLLKTVEQEPQLISEETKLVRKPQVSALEPDSPVFDEEFCEFTSSDTSYITILPFGSDPSPPEVPRKSLRLSRKRRSSNHGINCC